MLPQYIYHYYDESTGPLLNLSDLSIAEAKNIQQRLSYKSDFKCSQRPDDYIPLRFGLEEKLRTMFIATGGKPVRERPHYFTLGPCPWLYSWYPSPMCVRISLAKIPSEVISFTYGDLFPAMRFNDGARHSKRVYRLEDLATLLSEYGLPQEKNPDGAKGPKRYIEAQLWDDDCLRGIERIT